MRKHREQQRFDTPLSHYTVFRDLLREILEADTTFKADYLAKEMESKLLSVGFSASPEVRRTAAIDKWLASEELNQATNTRLLIHSDEDFLFLNDKGFPVMADTLFAKAKEFIAQTIGVSVPWDELKGSFSGGASTSVRRGRGVIARKYQEGTDITEGAIWHFLRLSKSDVWAPRDFTVVEGNVMFTVPKTSLIDRCACKEPDYNMFMQKAIGDSIRRSLKRKGLNLNDQTANQRLARQGSVDESLATIDLSSASDSVTTQLVLLLMPDEWFDLMDDVRSKSTLIDGIWHKNEMFSSMGNAFTFELESLIFWALTRACAFLTRTSGRISVYGDDIICPSGLKDAILSALEFSGFRVNQKKTFFEGPFRESCGKHWFHGCDVTPFYVKTVPVDVTGWCHLLNSLRRWADDNNSGVCDPRYFDIWTLFSELIPMSIRGHWDLSLKSNLCSPGRLPIARLASKQERDDAVEKRFSFGAYLHWLSAGEDRKELSELETSVFEYDGAVVLRRYTVLDPRTRPLFPQEFGVS